MSPPIFMPGGAPTAHEFLPVKLRLVLRHALTCHNTRSTFFNSVTSEFG